MAWGGVAFGRPALVFNNGIGATSLLSPSVCLVRSRADPVDYVRTCCRGFEIDIAFSGDYLTKACLMHRRLLFDVDAAIPGAREKTEHH